MSAAFPPFFDRPAPVGVVWTSIARPELRSVASREDIDEPWTVSDAPWLASSWFYAALTPGAWKVLRGKFFGVSWEDDLELPARLCDVDDSAAVAGFLAAFFRGPCDLGCKLLGQAILLGRRDIVAVATAGQFGTWKNDIVRNCLCRAPSLDIIDHCVQLGARFDGEMLQHFTSAPVARYLVRRKVVTLEDFGPLLWQPADLDLELFRYLCESKANATAVNHSGFTPLHMLMLLHSPPDDVHERVQILLTGGADPNIGPILPLDCFFGVQYNGFTSPAGTWAQRIVEQLQRAGAKSKVLQNREQYVSFQCCYLFY